MLRKSITLEIENFFNFIVKTNTSNKTRKVPLFKLVKKVKLEVFKHLYDSLLNEFYTDNDPVMKRWQGFRLLVVDGSRITLLSISVSL